MPPKKQEYYKKKEQDHVINILLRDDDIVPLLEGDYEQPANVSLVPLLEGDYEQPANVSLLQIMHQITMMKILQPLILLTTLRNDIDLSPNHPLSDHDDIEVSNIIRHKEITKRSLNPLRLPLLVPASNNSNINSNNFSPLLSTPNNSNINHNNVSSGASQFDSIFGLNDGAIDSVHVLMADGRRFTMPISSNSSTSVHHQDDKPVSTFGDFRNKESINPQMEEIAAFVDKSVTVHVLNRWLNATKMDELRAKIQWENFDIAMGGKVSSNIKEFEESGTEEFESSSIEKFEGSNTKESKGISNKLKY
ncbi:hypothetical protein GLOIN_2v1784267 [Rhizophagus irregularis DAOM 181602=DAOM 197198]|uniref:Uncharacterized protein n=1 Tax=Rhizophagus irregularis (strain DAOM 181602 / DAOM 197198 / MUCL 43194) TaxID=747089 RepID=A0A2P4PCX4_RHIID|nr:hypothetical protein GLOIN_2v1784267 [Rhizophagus irregularis DAOM 181602=DAOM 197198]POG63258.1 hypothetical protein GLOIN_2v1784267 [Rhizophagus irregularis DAOM 181602=DAOM 197198]|eukprot:XP_025170124.1 hypothetical protein GLOIN_2v1784267 [Rhizophagus irregularis DAOM 181602=DAOM 197198]